MCVCVCVCVGVCVCACVCVCVRVGMVGLLLCSGVASSTVGTVSTVPLFNVTLLL